MHTNQVHVTITSCKYGVFLFSLPSSFKQFLELEPLLRDVIHQFHQSHYTSCLQSLEEMRENLMLDMYLASHLSKLYKMIRNKALIQVSHTVVHLPWLTVFMWITVQYFSPYLSVDLHRMAAAFNTSVLSLEGELTQLILEGQISARIDSHAKVYINTLSFLCKVWYTVYVCVLL